MTVTAPRLSVATGMTLTGRVLGPDGRPWELHLRVDDASLHTTDLAMVRMSPSAVGMDDSRRGAERVPIGGVAWLEAVNCQDVVDRDRVDDARGSLPNRRGLHHRACIAGRRPAVFHGRFFADSIRRGGARCLGAPGTSPGQTMVGCRFIDIDEAALPRSTASSPAAVGRPSNGGLSISSLRGLASGGEDERLRRRRRRRLAEPHPPRPPAVR